MSDEAKQLRRQLDLILEALGGEEAVQQMIHQRVTVHQQVTSALDFSFVHRAETFYRDPNPSDPTPLPFVPARYFAARGTKFRLPTKEAPDVEAVVYMSEGRWVVDCPDFGLCKGAQVACEGDHRFLCHNCQNVRWKGAWIRTVWPGEREREEIERTVLARPEVTMRNWQPGWSVAAMRADNVEHGHPPRLEE